MDNGVMVVDFEGRIVIFNAAAEKILGIDADRVLRRYYQEVFFQSEGNDEFNDVLISVIAARRSLVYMEARFLRSDAGCIPLGITGSLLRDGLGSAYGAVLVFSDLSEIKRRQFLQDAFGRYVTKQVVDLVLSNPDTFVLDADEREATILFSDIRGFTEISENLPPKDLVTLLREYFALMVGATLKFQGMVDKFIGDAVMGIFGAPMALPNHAELAVRTALEMLSLVEVFNCRRFRQGHTYPVVRIGVGICTGTVLVGNIGSEERLEYTAIGDTVNLAARLEGLNKQYGTCIIVSQGTYEQVESLVIAKELGRVRIRGKRRAVRVFEVLGMKET
jgi:adenylate cyclase